MELNINIEEYLKRFKVYHSDILFEPAWNVLKQDRCPLCFNKLKFPRSGKIALCSSVKHKKTFVIHIQRLNYIKLTTI